MTNEHTTLLSVLDLHRGFLRHTVDGLSDEQARTTPTVSALSLGGLIVHVADVERQWADFIVEGAGAFGDFYDQFADGGAVDWEKITADRVAAFTLPVDRTLADALATYDAVAAHTADVLASTPDLDAAHPLPAAPWFEPGASWSARRVVLHILAETAQHAGHADIIRETIDGQRTMG